MIISFSIIFIVILLSATYLITNKLDKKKFAFLFLFLSFSTFSIYFVKGNIESFFYEENLKKKIENFFASNEKLADIQPELIIIYLEKKLKKNPEDIQGWMILTRTSVISGYHQKADLHYKSALKNFPHNENLLLEYSILLKNTNQTNAAMKHLSIIKKKFPTNIKARELIVDLYIKNFESSNAQQEIKELLELKENDFKYIEKLKKKYSLQ